MQDFVTDSVSVGIIDALELVDVQDEKRMKRIRTARPQKFINGAKNATSVTTLSKKST